MKLCLRCMRPINNWANKCPNCLDEHQGVLGRIILVVLFIAALIIGGKYYLEYRSVPQDNRQELINLLKKNGV